MKQHLGTAAFAAAVVHLIAASAGAQVPLAGLVPQLVLGDATLDSPPISGLFLGVQNPNNFTHAAHFTPLVTGELNNPVVGVVAGLNAQLATQLPTFPLGSATVGFAYVFDGAAGGFRRSSTSVGSLSGDRALTIGRRKLSVAVNYQHTSYRRFEGQRLGDGSIKFYLRHQECCHVVFGAPITLLDQPDGTRLNAPFENDLVEAALSVKATTDTTSFVANYGLTDRWDVGIVVPVVSMNLDASVTTRVIRFNTTNVPTLHAFDRANPDAPRTLRRDGRSTGIGDLVLRTKYSWLRTPGGGLAAAVDLRLPTGDEDNLLGTGGTRATVLLIASSRAGRRLAGHANVGYTVSGGDIPGGLAAFAETSAPDEINYSGGVEFAASRRVTLNGDFIGRTLRDAGRMTVVSKEFRYSLLRPGTCESSGFDCSSVFFDEFDSRPGNMTLSLGSVGATVNVTGNMLISGSMMVPLTRAGLRSRLSTVISLAYAF